MGEAMQADDLAKVISATSESVAEALKLGPVIGPAMAAVSVATSLAYVAQLRDAGGARTG